VVRFWDRGLGDVLWGMGIGAVVVGRLFDFAGFF